MRQFGSFAAFSLTAAVLILLLSAGSPAQDNLTPRTLYYNSGEVPAQPAAVKPKRPSVSPPPASAGSGSSSVQPADSRMPQPPPAVTHLGVRYNLLLVDADSGNSQPVDTASVFRRNDCLAVSVQSNYDGYLYVIDHGSSGNWDVLLPSPDISDESNFVSARTSVKAPGGYCFKVDDPPGTEHLFLIFSRNPQDISGLNAAVRSTRGSAAPSDAASSSNVHRAPEVAVQLARLEQGLAARDLRVAKVGKPLATGEPANAVYVVDASSAPSDRIVTELPIRHN